MLVAAGAGCGGDDGPPRPDLVFVSARDGDYALYAMDADGSRETRLSEKPENPTSPREVDFQLDPAWSRDGRLLAFSSRREGTLDLYVASADGTGARRVTSTRDEDRHPSFDPDGERLVFQRGRGSLFAVDLEGGQARRVTDDLAEEAEPAWSPDGRWIAYVRREPGTSVREVWLVRPDGSDRRRVTRMRSVIYEPAWSPDGSRLAFAAETRARVIEIFEIHRDGTGLRRVTTSNEHAVEPSYAPDGSTVAFARGGSIVVRGADGDEDALTSASSNDSSPVWNPIPASADD